VQPAVVRLGLLGAWDQQERVHEGTHIFLGTEEGEEPRREALRRIFSRGDVSAVLFEHDPPPYVASLYVHDDEEHHCADVSLGTVWREDRWPTIEEVSAAIASWGVAPPMRVAWWNGVPRG